MEVLLIVTSTYKHTERYEIQNSSRRNKFLDIQIQKRKKGE